jgi:23S rRNA pseudouridine1911/1915/1917 synthase
MEFVIFEPISKGLAPIVEEEHFVVYDKPSGLLIHPQSRYTKYTLVDELRYTYGKEANITHRIDQETSGLVLCAKNKKAEIDIKLLFQERQIEKSYLAFVHGEFPNYLEVDAPLLTIKEQALEKKNLVIVDPNGKESFTSFKLIEYFPDINMSLVEAKPYTGRQHQIRVHLFHVKHPIVGDPVYGQSKQQRLKYFNRELTLQERLLYTKSKRMLLHANSLKLTLYQKQYTLKSRVNFKSISLENVSCETNKLIKKS